MTSPLESTLNLSSPCAAQNKVRNPSEKEVDIIFLILLFKGFFEQIGEMSCLFLPCTVSWEHLPPRKNGNTQTKEIQ